MTGKASARALGLAVLSAQQGRTGRRSLDRSFSPAARERQWNLAVETLKPVADYAGERGVQLAVEPLNRFKTDFINTVEQGLELIDRIGAANARCVLP